MLNAGDELCSLFLPEVGEEQESEESGEEEGEEEGTESDLVRCIIITQHNFIAHPLFLQKTVPV